MSYGMKICIIFIMYKIHFGSFPMTTHAERVADVVDVVAVVIVSGEQRRHRANEVVRGGNAARTIIVCMSSLLPVSIFNSLARQHGI